MSDNYGLNPAGEVQLSAKAGLDLWMASQGGFFWAMDVELDSDEVFRGAARVWTSGDIGIGTMHASIRSGHRQRHHLARDGRESYSLAINTGGNAMQAVHAGRETILEPGAAVLLSGSEPFSFTSPDPKSTVQIAIPRQLLEGAARHVDARLGLRVGHDHEALRLLLRYCHFLESGDPLQSPDLQTHAADTIVELVSLATAATDGAGGLVNIRGVRAGRLTEVLGRMKAGFTQPDISAATIARELRLSARYIQDLLAETGIGFAERILELRLHRAREMLDDRHNDALLVSDIAYACGFSDISYFNRCFRRRFGCTPGSLR